MASIGDLANRLADQLRQVLNRKEGVLVARWKTSVKAAAARDARSIAATLERMGCASWPKGDISPSRRMPSAIKVFGRPVGHP